MDYKYGLFCRGFVVSTERIKAPKDDWASFIFSNQKHTFYVWYDTKNNIAYYKENNNWCFILGIAMDTVDWHMNLNTICKNIVLKLNESNENFYDYIDTLNGRFIIIFGNEDEAKCLNDATATRSVYYHENKCIIASHYKIIADITNESLWLYYLKYCEIEKNKPWTLPGDYTPYNNIKILTANHEILLGKQKIRRFYPRSNHKNYTMSEILQVLPTFLKNQMITLERYFTPIISVTGGNDSKVTMASSKDVRNKCVYFTFVNEMVDISNKDQKHRVEDLQYAQNVASLYNLNFKKLTLKPPLAPEIEKYVKLNHYHQHIPSAIPEYVKDLPRNGIHVQSNIMEIIRDLTYVYPKPPKTNTPQDVMSGWMMYWSKREEVRPYVENYWQKNEWDKIYNYERVRLFYWEHRMSTWNSAATLLENDWAFNTFLLLNCRKLLEYGFCIPKYFRDKNFLTKAVVKALWPELLFNIENSKYTLFDYYQVENYGREELLYKYSINSNVNYIDDCKIYNVVVSFDKSIVRAGDYVELVFDSLDTTDKFVQISLCTPSNNLMTSNKVKVYIKNNNKIIFEKDLSEIKSSTIVEFKAFSTIDIGLECVSDVDIEEYGVYSVLNIESIKINDDGFNNVYKI